MFVIKSENRKGFFKANKLLLFLQVIIIWIVEHKNIDGEKKALKIQYKELTAFLQVVDDTQDSAASLSKAATVY